MLDLYGINLVYHINTGEIKIGIINLGNEIYKIEKGHKVAQMIIQEKITAEIVESDNLDESSRGEGGFGSTGK